MKKKFISRITSPSFSDKETIHSLSENFKATVQTYDTLADKDDIDDVYHDGIFFVTKIKELDGSYRYSVAGTSIARFNDGDEILLDGGSIKLVVKDDEQ